MDSGIDPESKFVRWALAGQSRKVRGLVSGEEEN